MGGLNDFEIEKKALHKFIQFSLTFVKQYCP